MVTELTYYYVNYWPISLLEKHSSVIYQSKLAASALMILFSNMLKFSKNKILQTTKFCEGKLRKC
jgi:hypothetical protein